MSGRDVSSVERGLWSLHQSSGSGVCNTSVAVEIHSPLDVRKLGAALIAVVGRHEALRTGYRVVDGDVRGYPVSEADVEITVTSAEGRADEQLAREVVEEHDRPMDLGTGKLCRMRVWTRDSERHLVLLTMHHIAVDWTAMVVCAEEICLLYASGLNTRALPPLGAPYSEFVAEQRALISGLEGDQAWQYWSQALPAERAEPAVTPGARQDGPSRQRVLPLALDPDVRSSIGKFAWRHHVPANVVLLALWLRALHETQGRSPIVVGLPRTMRKRRFARTVGCFVNTMPLVVDAAGDDVGELVERVRVRLAEALPHQGYPIELLATRLPQIGVVRGRPPIYDVTFNYVPRDPADLVPLVTGAQGLTVELGELKMSPFPAPPSIGPIADFTLHHTETRDRLVGMVGYDAALFDDDTAARLRDRYLHLTTTI